MPDQYLTSRRSQHMARDHDAERRDNINRGLPKHSGLDEGTKASLQRSAEAGGDGIVVGSFRDLQVGDTDKPLEDRPLNPNQEGEPVLVTELPDPPAAEDTRSPEHTDTKKAKKK